MLGGGAISAIFIHLLGLTLLVPQFLVFGATLTARRARRGPPQAAETTPGTQSMDPPPLRL